MFCKTEALQNFTNFTRTYLWLSPMTALIPRILESLAKLSNLFPHTYNCTSNDILTCVFLWIYLCENIFSLLSFTQVCAHRNFLKIHRKTRPYQTLWTPAQMFFWEILKVLGISFYRTSLNDRFWFQFNLLTVRTFLFQNRWIFV